MDIQAYTQRSRSVIQAAQTEAVTRDHQQLTPAHILQALIIEDGGLPRNLLQMAGASPDMVAAAVTTTLKKLPKVEGGSSLSLSKASTKVFAIAEKTAKQAGDAFVTLERLLLATVTQADKDLRDALSKSGLDAARLGEAIKSVRSEDPVTSDSAEDQYEALSKYARDLTDAARNGKLDPVIGRDEEIRRTLQVLSRRSKNNPLSDWRAWGG